MARIDEGPSLVAVLCRLTTEAEMGVLGYLPAFRLLQAHLLFFFERGSSDISSRYCPGIFEAAWWVLATITAVGYGDVTPGRWFGRIVSLMVTVIGIFLFGAAIAQRFGGLMMEGMKREISGPDDLGRRTVATLAGTTSADVAIRYGSRLGEVPASEKPNQLLGDGDVDAFLSDSAPLMRFAREGGNTDMAVVGPLLEKQDYGTAFPGGRPLRESTNQALPELKASGQYNRIYSRWLGTME